MLTKKKTEAADMRKFSVALVDDEREIADYMGGLLSSRFSEYIGLKIFYSGQKALDFLKSRQCDLLISDIRMPVTDGFALLEHIVAEGLPTEVIFLTAYKEFDYIYKLLRQKSITYLVKTEREKVILDTIGQKLQEIVEKQEEIEQHEKVELLCDEIRKIAFTVENIHPIEQTTINEKTSETGHENMNRIKLYIKNNIEHDVSLAAIAKHFYYNPSYLSRAFSQAFGKKMSDYVLECKIATAKRYLAETDIPIIKIAESLGYQSSQALIRSFKKQVGVSPKEWGRMYSDIN